VSQQRAVLLAAVLLFFWMLGGHDLWAPDEPYFAEGAREMVVDGRWAVPHVNGEVTTDKPPLFFWLIALFSLPLGSVTSFTSRLPSALAAVGTVVLTMRLGRRFYSPRTATLAGAVLVTTYMFWAKARTSQIDSLLCLLVWVALSAFEAFRAGEASGRRAGLLFWLASALAVLAKGPVGLMLPLGIALTTLAVDRNLGRWRRFAPASGPMLFAMIIGLWMVLATVGGNGEYSVWHAFQEHVIDRAVTGLHHEQPPWYYLMVLPLNLLPWTCLVPGALVRTWRRRQAADRFLLVAAFFVVVFFSIPTEKRGLYVLPAFPALALMIGELLRTACGWIGPNEKSPVRVDRRWVTAGQGVIGGLVAMVGLLLPVFARRFEQIPRYSFLALAFVFAAAGIATLWFAWRGRPLSAALTPAAGFAVAYLIAVTAVFPAFEPLKSGRDFALRIKEVTAESRAAGHPVFAYRLGNLTDSFSFYSDGVYTVKTYVLHHLIRHLRLKEPVFAVVNRELLEVLPRRLRSKLLLVDSTHLNSREVLLITNDPYPGATPLEWLAATD
jgi:4-amino-4-deoxy-L-arabinose transferase-like glycosyltransferase